MTREELIAAATVLHDEECRSCDRKYRMSCPNMANAILRSGPAAGRYRTDVVKPFCPCDAGRPQDCQPEDWPGAHTEPPCLDCGRKRYQHHGHILACAPLPSVPG